MWENSSLEAEYSVSMKSIKDDFNSVCEMTTAFDETFVAAPNGLVTSTPADNDVTHGVLHTQMQNKQNYADRSIEHGKH